MKNIDPQVTSAYISAIGTILAALIAAIAGSLVGRKFLHQRNLIEKLEEKQKDIDFLYAVEEEHCNNYKDKNGASRKNTIREKVRVERGLEWSGKNTPGRVKNP